MSFSKSSGAGAPPSRRPSFILPRSTTAPAPKSRGSLFSTMTLRSSQPTPLSDAKETPTRSESPTGSVNSSTTSIRSNTAPPQGPPAPRRRASLLTDALKRIPSRTSLTGNTSNTLPTRTIRPVDSISSIREVHEESRTVEELQQKLKDASESLAAKSEEAAALTAELLGVKSSLDASLARSEAQSATISELEASNNTSTSEIERLKEEHRQVQVGRKKDLAFLETVQKELETAKAVALARTELVQTLQDHNAALVTEVSAAKNNLQALRISHESDLSNAAVAAQIEHQALLKAQSDLTAISAKTEALEASHAAVLEEISQKLINAQERAAEADDLENEVEELKAQKEDNVGKLSELEIEILELRESQEKAENENFRILSHLQKLEEGLAEAAAATQQALRNAQEKEVEHARESGEMRKLHDQQLQIAKDDLAKMTASLEASQQKIATAHAAHEQTKAGAQVAAKEHARELEEAERAQINLQIELSEEIRRITVELQRQEAEYHATIEAVEAEHNALLHEAVEHAKNEAGFARSRDLQALRVESQSTIKQLRSVHQSSIEFVKAEHEEVLQSAITNVEHRFTSQAMELRATMGDLANAKAELDASRVECDSLRAQLENARATAAASLSPEQVAEIERLTQDIVRIRDENVKLNQKVKDSETLPLWLASWWSGRLAGWLSK